MFGKLSIDKRKTKNILAAITVFALTIFWFWQERRDQKLSELILEASGRSAPFQLAPDPVSAVQMLAEFDDADAREAILLMAGARPDTLPIGVQEHAIRALEKQNTAEACHVLAQVLQPHFLAAYRAEAAKLLAEKKCDKLTVVYVLHYLNQIAKGERELESRFLLNDRLLVSEDLIQERRAAVTSGLYRMLDRNREVTGEVLAELYGIGSDSPTNFAIQLVREAEFAWACYALSRTQQVVDSNSPDTFIAPRSEIQQAITSLKCVENTGQ